MKEEEEGEKKTESNSRHIARVKFKPGSRKKKLIRKHVTRMILDTGIVGTRITVSIIKRFDSLTNYDSFESFSSFIRSPTPTQSDFEIAITH